MGRKLSAGFPHRGSNGAQRVVILGLARQGMALARYFLDRGATVTISDARPATTLTAACAELQAYAAGHGRAREALHFVLGEHPLSLLDDADMLCLSGGVWPGIPLVQRAGERGIPLTNDSLLTLQRCPAPIIGITGSSGKTTTSTLTGLMLEAAGYTVHVGGNIGTPLIDRLDLVQPGDKVVMELSSFQLELFSASPAIAAILNITPNHLDRHRSMSQYAAAKANILRFQRPGDTSVLNADDAWTRGWLSNGRCEIPAGNGQEEIYFPLRAALLAFSLEREVVAGAYLDGGRLMWRAPCQPDVEICRTTEVRLRGRHNLANLLAAACLASCAGAGPKAIASVATTFEGVEHRLEIIRERDGVLWVNDSIATTPERAAAALRSFSEPIIWLAGGRDKHLPWNEVAQLAHERCKQVVVFGEAASMIEEALRQHGSTTQLQLPISRCADVDEATAKAAQLAQAGDVVLLAPGGTSFDAYADFEARGRHFRHLVEALP